MARNTQAPARTVANATPARPDIVIPDAKLTARGTNVRTASIGSLLVVVIDTDADAWRAKDGKGKMDLIASTGGFQNVDADGLRISVLGGYRHAE